MERVILGVISLGVAPSLKPTRFFLLLDRSLSPVLVLGSQRPPRFAAPDRGAFTPHLASV